MANRPSPTVSIILPTYNRAALLPPVITSILDQDFADFELVIFDDGSTDNTADVVREIQARDARLRYVALPKNRGIGYARDAGLRYAAGRYVALADSDDLWLPGRLRTQVKILEKYPEIDILFGDFLNIDHVRGTQGLGLVGGRKGLELVVTRHIEDDLFLVEGGLEIGILRSNFIAAPTMVLRRKVFDRVGGYNVDLSTPVDLEFCWRAAVLGARYAYTARPLIERHKYSDSMTAQADKPWLDRLAAVEVMYRTCQEAGRPELLRHVHSTEVRTYRNLIRIYGERGQRVQVVRVYVRSLRCGVSARTLALFLLALLGSRGISMGLNLNRRLQAV